MTVCSFSVRWTVGWRGSRKARSLHNMFCWRCHLRFFQYEKMHASSSQRHRTTKRKWTRWGAAAKKASDIQSMGILTAFTVDSPYVCLGKSYVYLCGLCFGWMCLQLRQPMRLCFKYFQTISFLLMGLELAKKTICHDFSVIARIAWFPFTAHQRTSDFGACWTDLH